MCPSTLALSLIGTTLEVTDVCIGTITALKITITLTWPITIERDAKPLASFSKLVKSRVNGHLARSTGTARTA